MSESTGPQDTGIANLSGGDDFLAGLVDDFLRRYRAGEAPSVDEYTSKHPNLASRILELFPVMLEMEQRAADATLDAVPSERVGAVIGRYTLLERVGEGGFGLVYMAEQTTPMRRKVALKVIKPGMDSHEVLARFEAERQALAMMDHPNIAKVLDAGATETGRPYFVMELVKGEPITTYCDNNQLSPRQRLELFLQVCHAVQHAHQKGVIHRDLKPTNVLVAVHDTTAVVKVIDFGVAKALGQELTEKTLFTPLTQLVGTPLYMSPEQAGQGSLDIDTRSDIYSLGVLMYELLTGTTPFDKQRFRQAAHDEIRRIIREEEPPRPSTRLSESKATLPSVSAQRDTEPAKLTKMVRGELDWIVMKALEKDRARRYETANDFGRDIQRYLADEPVEACPPSAGYRLQKFARKNYKLLATAGAFLALLGAAATISTWQTIRTKSESNDKTIALAAERQARADETKARQQAFAALRSMTADVVQTKFAQAMVLTENDRAFLQGIISQYDAFSAIKANDPDSRATRAEGRFQVANVRRTLGRLKEAEEDYAQALSIQKQLAAEFPSRSEFRAALAATHDSIGFLLNRMGRLPEAEDEYAQALIIYDQLAADFPSRPDFRLELARTHSGRGIVLSAMNRLPDAQRDFEQALSIHKLLAADPSSGPDFRLALANFHTGRALMLRVAGKREEAEQEVAQALSIYEQLAADFPSQIDIRLALARSHGSRGDFLSYAGRLPEAEQDYGRALSIFKQLAADFPARPECREELAISHFKRGNMFRTAGRFKEAEQDYGQAVDIQKQLVGDFPSTTLRLALADSHQNRGIVLRAVGRLKEAEQDYEQALSIYEQVAPDFTNQSDFQNNFANICTILAGLHRQRRDFAAGKRLLLEGQPHHRAALEANPGHPIYRQFYSNHLMELIKVHAGLLEQQEAIRTAETRRDLGWDAPTDAYDATCALSQSVSIVAEEANLDAQQRKEAAQFYGDAAMKLLREAVARGYQNVAQMTKDIRLDPLRQREDFQQLIAELLKGK